ncbi:HTH-type transcriptional repressor YtrA [Lentilactobacillus parabuchneri]|jgi:DNA-binding transcriptional regulator YhcF (GntR family)|uniref:GntR family transcriptional regulator n=2 Tax=Lentilactobacillus parabuchneri TaxID=152331 RepID=A0A1X1FF82_9LACO|nr:GntR family transcriptional regulator [Lentilactobacillus parabuchneri]APR07306.1 HTH-type transcriptional repressor YtrA [Lentilactobacillus parabuchneri]KRM47340.1 GntR family transcriptional regulator [Lentilactobacillus parabuchneri DSM 5707 = NBRC 107865]KRN78453.1 GntR family transcriptional regulator [Lentilactobacillus parabuchneri]MBW0223039.1 GntR family transcriptional regulator [Lentilactobacillus parabuchneri]MBW0245348.1 GntR family transcriptional regulator [Lentilactobacillu
MKFDDKIPIYYQIKSYIYREIIVGELAPGDKLPAVRQLAVDLTVNVNTVQRALGELISEKIIEPQRGKGNFVTEDREIIEKLKKMLITEQLQELYENLYQLNVTDDEIVTYLQTYINERKQVQL